MSRSYAETLAAADRITATLTVYATAAADLDGIAEAARLTEETDDAVDALDAAAERLRTTLSQVVMVGLEELVRSDPHAVLRVLSQAADTVNMDGSGSGKRAKTR